MRLNDLPPLLTRDIEKRKVIIPKGLLVLLGGLLGASLLLWRHYDLADVLLLSIAVWASCRFYYFLFLVLERYVDHDFRFAGLASLLNWFAGRRRHVAPSAVPAAAAGIAPWSANFAGTPCRVIENVFAVPATIVAVFEAVDSGKPGFPTGPPKMVTVKLSEPGGANGPATVQLVSHPVNAELVDGTVPAGGCEPLTVLSVIVIDAAEPGI